MKNELAKFDRCLQHEVSFCTAACPYNLDVNTFISRIQEGRFNAAYKCYRDATGFPEIAAAICTENCRESCLRNAVAGEGHPIELLKLEKACLQYAKRKDPVNYNIPSKNRSIAIIGGGISGIACAMRLATKKYRVTVYEKGDRIGGHLLSIMDPETVDADFALQMQNLEYELKLNTEIIDIAHVVELGYEDNRLATEKLNARSAVASVMRSSTTNAAQAFEGTYDAIYVATGADGSALGIDFDSLESPCTMYEDTAVFFGGSLTGSDSANALANGLKIATSIDNYILTGIIRYPEPSATDIAIDETRYVETKAVAAGECQTDSGCKACSDPEADSGCKAGETYTKDEAVEEAKRCMKCQCNACRLHCDLTEYVHKWPLRLRDEIVATTAPGKSELHATPAVRLINSCTHCGLCADTCPADIDMDALIQAARVRMHRLDKMPWAFNDFFLRDMEFSLGDEAHICASAGAEKSASEITGADPGDSLSADGASYAFFPGCQLGASSPESVLKAYEYLQKQYPSTGIILGCCGIPAMWAGDEDLHEEVLQKIRDDWNSLGKPIVVLACPTCSNNFEKYLPEIETTFIYDLMAESELVCIGDTCSIEDFHTADFRTAAVFDPCATKDGDKVRLSVRRLCTELGIGTEPLSVQEKWSACCSFGGHGEIADPAFAEFVRSRRVDESHLPYITYCVNCRDSFMKEGKRTAHILDLIFGVAPKQFTWTERRENRTWLKRQIMKNIETQQTHNEKEQPKGDSVKLIMSDAVRQKLSNEYILEEEVSQAVEFCERTGRTFLNQETGTYSGYRKIGHMTYWVEYRPTGNPLEFELVNAYTHRMTIDLEMVWNGKKVDICD